MTQTQQEPSLFLWIPRRTLQEQIGDALRSQKFGRLVVTWRSDASNKIYCNYSCAQLRSDNISSLSPAFCCGIIPFLMTFVERCKRPTDAIAAQQRCFALAMDDVLGQIIKNYYQQRRDEYIDESDCIYKIWTIARAINQNHNIRKHIIMTGGK